jgi:signal transduction histidine kinase
MLADGDFGQVTTQQKAAIADAETKSEDLLGLIDDILEVARIEDAAITLSVEPIAPAALLAELVYEWGHRFTQEGTTTSTSVADDAPVFKGDKPLLKRVFSNLIQNAVTHSSHPIHLELSARRSGQGVLFTVSDNGPGIPPEYHELIFRKFGQVEMPRSPRTRSSGLGLTFCKLVVERHGGRIWLRSTEGKGSSFYIELPIEPTVNEEPPSRSL